MTKTIQHISILAAALILPFFVGPYGHFVLCMAAVYAMISLSLNVLLGMGGLISIGHAGFWAVGAYSSAILVDKLGIPFLLAVVLAAIISAAIGLLVALPALRVRGHYLAIATLGFSLVLVHILYEWDSLTGGRQGMFVQRPSVFGYELSTDFQAYYLLIALFCLMGWLVKNFRRSLGGLAQNSVRQSELAGQCCGVNLTSSTFFVFAFSAAITGISGAVYGSVLGQLSTDSFTLVVSLSFLTMAVVGGMRSFYGAVLGGLFLAYAPELLRAFEEWQMFLYGALLILFMHFLPDGLVSLPARIKGLRGKK
ncbi:branched-chain amino acid ABC transporter permease [Pollutimonas sp. M17]|uniref:branched-chain amino acid ABC transporter permease n=1 Tax=Pollutimonas sp. M17 TaxID=2962065 RepID=UPI0021F3CF7B|nr:branched-chain amino acid ABC transporter permease [Pollutimonas sp. M17]UYO94817.1 branched-chain amino acid ABC transporter permease [Pollutimonas sp. M17]